MAKVLLIEDESLAANRLQQLLQEAEPELEILPVLGSVQSAVAWLQENPAPDLILMDVKLSDGTGFDIFQQVHLECPVIFVTGYSEFALKAFRVDAMDYLLKPVQPENLELALNKYKKAIQTLPAFNTLLQPPENQSYIKRILIRFGQTIKLIEISDIAYFYTRDKLNFLVSQSTGKRIPVDYSLDKLEEILDPELFFRVNRQLIVHIQAIREMSAGPKSRIIISLNPSLDQDAVVSSEKSGVFKRWLVGENSPCTRAVMAR